ncbi:MAG: PPC domain-containing protein [bacterium]
MNHPGARAIALLSLLAFACTPAMRTEHEQAALIAAEFGQLRLALANDSPAPDTLRIRLAFGAHADLDLFVTDPAQESVYFANSPSRSGGRLESDRRCTDTAPRVETVAFPQASAGRYRVGVDYPKACTEPAAEVPFVVRVDGLLHDETIRGTIAPGVFWPIVLEVDHYEPPAKR